MASQNSWLIKLPTEVQLIIYQFVLCPPEGLKVCASTASRYRKFGECLDNPPQFAAIPPVNVSILRVCKCIEPIALDALYFDQYEIILNLSIDLSRYFLLYVIRPDAVLSRIRALSFTQVANMSTRANTEETATALVQEILVSRMSRVTDGCLQYISVAMPDDFPAARYVGIPDLHQNSCFRWYLTDCLVRAFKDGHFRSIRFVHPRKYPANISPYIYHNVLTYLQPIILGHNRSFKLARQPLLAMEELVEEYYYSSEPMPPAGYLLRESYRRADEVISHAWKSSGFSLSIERPNTRPNGTVLVLTRCRDTY